MPKQKAVVGPTIVDAPHAPIVYFEQAPVAGHVNGLIRITVSAERSIMSEGAIESHQTVTAYLRTNIQGARSLLDALQKSLLLAQATAGGTN